MEQEQLNSYLIKKVEALEKAVLAMNNVIDAQAGVIEELVTQINTPSYQEACIQHSLVMADAYARRG